MSSLFRRLTALLLCLCLMAPCLTLAEQAHSIRFTLEAEMFPEAYPQADQSLMRSLSELVNMIDLEGVFQYNEDCIDLDASFTLAKDAATRTAVRIYGNDAYWGVQSSLFGEKELMLNMQALLEFCMKAYFHLEVPLQRVGLFVSPYVHTNGLGTLTVLWNRFMNAQTGTRTISRDDVLTMARHISTAADTDRAFTYWVRALALESGYDSAIQDFATMLPQWAETFVGEDGIVITMDGEDESWSTNGITLFSRQVKDGWTTISFSLPENLDGYVVSGFSTTQDKGTHFNANIRLTVTQYGESILDLRLAADNLPQMISAGGDFSLTYGITGAAMPEGFHFKAEGTTDGGVFTIHQKDASTGEAMLTITGTASPAAITSSLDWTQADLPGVEFFSLSDVTLAQFIKDVQSPLFKGLVALISRAPMSACQSLMDLVMDMGIFDVLTASSSSLEDEDEGYYDEDYDLDEGAWDEEDWDEDSWDEEDWDDIDWEDDDLYE